MMDDLDLLIEKLKAEDPEFADGFERGYEAFKIGALLKSAREQAGMTQQQVAEKLGTRKSAISRMENHAADIRLSTLQRYAEAVGCHLVLELQPDAEQKPARMRISRPRRKLVAADSAS
jgi:HTH-type transcriptional regulator/antitoxin HipB